MNWIGLAVNWRIAAMTCRRAFRLAAVDHECALIAGLHDDVGAVADEHGELSRNAGHVDFAVARFRIHGLARFERPLGAGSVWPSPSAWRRVSEPCAESRIHRLRAGQARHRAVACSISRIPCANGCLPEQVVGHRVRGLSRICSPSSQAYSQAPMVDQADGRSHCFAFPVPSETPDRSRP